MENLNLTCHIIGLNTKTKKYFIENIDNKEFNIIDLDQINNNILVDPKLDKFYEQFTKLKEIKNDKYKEVEKKMTLFWKNSFYEKINELISKNKKNIFIGVNNHYKMPSNKISLNTKNNFIVLSDIKEDIKILIENNIDNNRNEIINGNFPLEFLNFDFLLKKRDIIITSYKKNGYIEKKLDDIILILNSLIKATNNENLWISVKEPYNINSKIYPKDNILYAYNDPTIALIESFNFDSDEVEKILTITDNQSTSLSLKEIKPNSLNKLKKKRFLYSVNRNDFLPFDNTNNKYFTQTPIEIKYKEKINDVHNYLGI
jgi:hypothetical protein